jgi:hypothetical protein
MEMMDGWGQVSARAQESVQPKRSAHLTRPESLIDAGHWLTRRPVEPGALAALQRMAGNHAVASLFEHRPIVQRQGGVTAEATKPELGWPQDEGVNKSGEMVVDGVSRYTLHGLPAPTTDAIVLVPKEVNPAGPFEVLIHLHGHGFGFHVKTKEAIEGTPHDLPGLPMGKVRDIDWDRLESQLHTLVKGRPMIGILPQATDKKKHSRFGGAQFDRVALVNNVFAALSDLKGITLEKPTGVVLSGHSGAGATFAAILGKESKRLKEAQQGSTKDAPPPMNELILFDAINGPGELGAITTWVRDQLNDDLKQLQATDDKSRATYIEKHPRLRGYCTYGVPSLKNVTYADYYLGKTSKLYAAGNSELAKMETPPFDLSLEEAIEDWFTRHAGDLDKLGSDLATKLRANYTIEELADTQHEASMGGEGKDRFVEALKPTGAP